MKVYNLNIDTTKPTRQVLNVPTNTEKYGIAVNAIAGEKKITNPYCQIIDGSAVLSSAQTLDDGSFLFELSSGSVPTAHEVMVHVISMDELSASDWDGVEYIYSIHAPYVANSKLNTIVRHGTLLWYRYLNDEGQSTPYADDEKIVFTGPAEIGHNVTKKIGGRPKQVWETLGMVPTGSYYPRELNRMLFADIIGLPADCKTTVVLKETKDAVPDGERVDTFSKIVLDGVSYVPTALSVDGIEYKVLASVPENAADGE